MKFKIIFLSLVCLLAQSAANASTLCGQELAKVITASTKGLKLVVDDSVSLARFIDVTMERCGVGLICELSPEQISRLGHSEVGHLAYKTELYGAFIDGLGPTRLEVGEIKSAIHLDRNLEKRQLSEAHFNYVVNLKSKLVSLSSRIKKGLEVAKLDRKILQGQIGTLAEVSRYLGQISFELKALDQSTLSPAARERVTLFRESRHYLEDGAGFKSDLALIDKKIEVLAALQRLIADIANSFNPGHIMDKVPSQMQANWELELTTLLRQLTH